MLFLICFCSCHSGGSGAQRWISREAVLHVTEPAHAPEEVQRRAQICRLSVCVCVSVRVCQDKRITLSVLCSVTYVQLFVAAK